MNECRIISCFLNFRVKERTEHSVVFATAQPARKSAWTLTSRKTPLFRGACPIPVTGTITGPDFTVGCLGTASSQPPSPIPSQWANRVACCIPNNLELSLSASARVPRVSPMTSISMEPSSTSIDRFENLTTNSIQLPNRGVHL